MTKTVENSKTSLEQLDLARGYGAARVGFVSLLWVQLAEAAEFDKYTYR